MEKEDITIGAEAFWKFVGTLTRLEEDASELYEEMSMLRELFTLAYTVSLSTSE